MRDDGIDATVEMVYKTQLRERPKETLNSTYMRVNDCQYLSGYMLPTKMQPVGSCICCHFFPMRPFLDMISKFVTGFANATFSPGWSSVSNTGRKGLSFAPHS